MNKYDLVKIIENFAPLELQEKWDCSGWIVETSQIDVKRVMIALTVDEKIFKQALNKNCDMIISHHPLFYVPLEYRDIQMYCAHTNLDKAKGGTTDTLIDELKLDVKFFETDEFVRYIELKEKINDGSAFIKLKQMIFEIAIRFMV